MNDWLFLVFYIWCVPINTYKMDLSIYFQPSQSAIFSKEVADPFSFGENIEINDGKYFPSLDVVDIAFFGVFESRNSMVEMDAKGFEVVRKHLYSLFPNNYTLKVADLGNVLPGESVEDTYFAVSEIVKQCVKQNVIPIIVGGSQDLTYANYKAYEDLEQIVNLTSIDPKFDLGEAEDALTDKTYLTKIILHQPNYLFNYCNIGHQSYFVKQESEDLMKNMFFDLCRLGEAQNNIQLVEPMLRFTDVLSVDLSAIRASEYGASELPIPNGFYGEEMCQMMRYAGMSDKLTSLGLYAYNPIYDQKETSAQLIAQMLWCFVDGYYNRTRDFPVGDKKDYQKFIVPIKDAEYQLNFYKSDKSDRWWLEVPFPSKRISKYERHQLVPCSYEHYQIACKDEMPDIWWKTYQKLV